MADQDRSGLNIAIIGSGIAGLSTAIALRIHGHRQHLVTVFEKYPDHQPVFSGPIQLTPNATSVLTRYGVAEAIEACQPDLHSVHNLHRYSDGKLLRTAPAASLKNAFGSPVWNISRAMLGRILLERARSVGVECIFNTAISDVDTESETPSLLTDKEETRHFDLIIAADGIRSRVRSKILGYEIEPVCQLTAYSLNVPRKLLAADPELAFMLNRSGVWAGPNRSVNQMDMPDFEDSCNFCFASEDSKGIDGRWDIECDIEEVKETFADFDPRLRRILSLADGACYLWKLADIPRLDNWQGHNKRVVLIGDAAHAMLPHSAMGAASGIEDSLCLAECLGQVPDITTALAAYESIRKPRIAFVTETGRQNVRISHMADGPEQEARDAALLQNPAKPNPTSGSPAQLTQDSKQERKLEDFDPPGPSVGSFAPQTRAYLMSYDVLEHTRAYINAAKV